MFSSVILEFVSLQLRLHRDLECSTELNEEVTDGVTTSVWAYGEPPRYLSWK